MAHRLPLNLLYRGESEARARGIWSAVETRAESNEGVRPLGDFQRDGQFFLWTGLGRARIEPFDDNAGPERWTVPDTPHVELLYEPDQFNDAVGDEPRLEALATNVVELATLSYTATNEQPRFVYGVTGLHQELLSANDVPLPVTAESLSERRIEYATWLMVFPPAMVESYGRETLLSAPAWHTEELDDGAVLVVSTPNPTYPGETATIDDHLGIDRHPELDEHRY